MKQLYLDIKTELSSITTPALHVDLLTNQLSNIGDIPSLPCAFIDFTYTYYKSTSAGAQLGDSMVRILLGFDPAELTGVNATDFIDIKNLVYSKLQGLANSNKYTALTRGGERTETKYNNIYFFEIDFYTTILDTEMSTKKDSVHPWSFNLVKGE